MILYYYGKRFEYIYSYVVIQCCSRVNNVNMNQLPHKKQMSSLKLLGITVIIIWYLTILVGVLNTFEALMKCQDNLTMCFARFINALS